ncbi:pyridoxal-phosphate dependent enzyme [Pseudoxanthomonas sp. UTMC 1351]|uniref:pyridoxal-phosphate dependent enzyme n=1 Tax=Pseudoxanthomonas sp. UTMC 1351 TaxID=2695853 RepID=UPI0034CFF8D0
MTKTPLHDFDITHIWEDYRPTRLIGLPSLAKLTGVARVFAKLESERPLGNFKLLGGMVAGLWALARAAGVSTPLKLRLRPKRARLLPKLVCASDGNHGLAVAAAARWAGTTATIHLPVSVSRFRVDRIRSLGGAVVTVDGSYDDAVRQAAAAAADGQGILVSDTTTDLNDIVVADVMRGYSIITRELAIQLDEARVRPSHLFVQAGVGGLAAAMAEGLHMRMRPPGRILVVEPERAACVARGLEAGQPVSLTGDLETVAEMLSCGTASAPALAILQRHHAQSVVVTDDQLRFAVDALRRADGPETTASGAAGLAGFLKAAADAQLHALHGLDSSSDVLLVVTEGPD